MNSIIFTKLTRCIQLKYFILLFVSGMSFGALGRELPGVAGSSFQSDFVEHRAADGSLVETAPYFCNINGVRMYLTRDGITYNAEGRKRLKTEHDEDHGEEAEIAEVSVEFTVRFKEASPQLYIEPAGLQEQTYITHRGVESSCFKQVIFKEVWPHIDLVYSISKAGGIKYDVRLHAGANLEDIQLDYSEAYHIERVSESIRVYSALGSWVEHAPVTYKADGTEVSSSYDINDRVISFQIEGYTSEESYVIDPWIELLPQIQSYDDLTNPADSVFAPLGGEIASTGLSDVFNRVQIDYDRLGNIYVAQIPCLYFISNSEFSSDDYYPVGSFVHKYSPEGELIYTLDQGYEFYLTTDISVNRNTQEVYVLRDFDEITHISPGGQFLNSILEMDDFEVEDAPEEICSFQYDHCNDSITVGFGASFNVPATFMGTASPQLTQELELSTSYDLSGSSASGIPYNDNVDLIIDPYSGDYFYLFLLRTLDGFLEQRSMLRVEQESLNPIWQVSGEYLYLVELRMHSQGTIFIPGRNHFESLAVGRNYLYATNGDGIYQFDKETGELMNEATAGGIQFAGRSEGIDIDLCGRLYVGGNEEIRVFSEDLTFLQSIPLSGMPQDIVVFGDKVHIAEDLALEQVQLPENLKPWELTMIPDSCDLCVGGAEISFCGQGEAPENVSVEWLSNGNTSLTTGDLCAGWNLVKIYEEKGCVVQEYTDSVFVETLENSVCAFTATVEDIQLCAGECGVLFPQVNGQAEPVTYEWSTGVITEADSLVICPNVSTTYDLVATDALGEVSITSVEVQVDELDPIDLGDDLVLCPGEEWLLNAGSVDADYQWQDGSIGSEYLVSTPGIYSVTASLGACTVNDSVEVQYEELAIDLGPDLSVCSLEAISLDAGDDAESYQWQDGTTESSYQPEEFGIYSVTGLSGDCSVTDSITISLDTLLVDLGPDQVFCSGDEVVLDSGLEIGDHLWSDGSSGFTLTVTQAGEYDVFVTDGQCAGADTIMLQMSEVAADFTVDDFIGCEIDPVPFFDQSTSLPGDIADWSWDFGDGFTSSVQDPIHSYQAPGLYQVELTIVNNAGCLDSHEQTVEIELYPLPDASFTFIPVNPMPGEEVNFTDASVNTTNWLWNFGEGSASEVVSPTFEYNLPGVYDITLVVENEYCTDSLTVEIVVEDELIYYVPNTFTPNNDGVNDLFGPILSGIDADEFDFQVFNRWGEVVFKSTDPQQQWDGSFRGNEEGYSGEYYAPDGIYVWRMLVKSKYAPVIEEVTGHVLLLR